MGWCPLCTVLVDCIKGVMPKGGPFANHRISAFFMLLIMPSLRSQDQSKKAGLPSRPATMSSWASRLLMLRYFLCSCTRCALNFSSSCLKCIYHTENVQVCVRADNESPPTSGHRLVRRRYAGFEGRGHEVLPIAE